MFSSFVLPNPEGKRSNKLAAKGVNVMKATNRRLLSCGHLMCRLPLLVLWTIVVIFILYKSTSNKNTYNDTQQTSEKKEFQASYLYREDLTRTTRDNLLPQHLSEQIGADESYSNNNGQDEDSHSPSEPSFVIPTTRFQQTTPLSTTKKSSTSEHARQSKVFILIVQNEYFRSQNIKSHHRKNSVRQTFQKTTTTNRQPTRTQIDDMNHHRIAVPAHIRLLIEILDSHRIGYTIDTTGSGLPTQLLADQGSKQYSVVVIDNLLKYTKLNRWLRDQLDRHCRSNDIGVITYLTQVEDFDYSTIGPTYYKASYNHILSQRSTLVTSSTETLADQFPLTIKPIDQNCRNLSSSNCLVDYQLNEKAQVLRILKRKQNFILKGELRGNRDQSPWLVMSSNHVTYEPITWAKLRKPPLPSSLPPPPKRRRRYALYKTNKNGEIFTLSGTQQRNHKLGDIGMHKRAALFRAESNNTLDEYADGLDEKNVQADEQNNWPLQAYDEFHSTTDDQSDEQLASVYGSIWHETSSLSGSGTSFDGNDDVGNRQVLSMLDKGLYDGIRRVIFGLANDHWLNRILLLDSIEHLSSGKIITPLDRYIQVDIDDIFVGERGIRLKPDDVDNLIKTQMRFAQLIEGGFKFNLGFSGKYFKHGYEDENLGDELLVKKANEFNWFCHFWSHSKAHLFNNTEGIVNELRKNLEFARDKNLPIIGYSGRYPASEGGEIPPPTYAVAPHHSGVYPIHEQLFEAWHDVLNVQVTSTEEYPQLRPANGRRAFVHKTIKVLPRQTCGLYTHTIYKRKYPGGFGKLLASINGGELFETILHNPVNIYMTHMSNYANDRLAPFTFAGLFDFVRANTNLQLKFAASSSRDETATTTTTTTTTTGNNSRHLLGPAVLADYYFGLYPDEREPIWTNPCKDKRHLAIWSAQKHKYCQVVPSLLIVGPQKTGTTALYSFLKLNPLFRSSLMSPYDYEEVQFFNDKHYFKGTNWYLDRFPLPSSDGVTDAYSVPNGYYYFDKSATYFDDPKVPRRASSLLPDARIVILLINPADRAYSWYQHIKAHGDLIANSMSFEQIIQLQDNDLSATPISKQTLTSTQTMTNKFNISQLAAARMLRNRCLHPGYYARHLLNWLDHYPSRQIIIIDGEWFRYNPGAVLNRLQLLLRVRDPLDYNKLLVFSEQKGFFCQRLHSQPSASMGNISTSITSNIKCLGTGKGRKYQPMSREARAHLNRHYRTHNRQLARLLADIGQPLPNWLDESINLMHDGT